MVSGWLHALGAALLVLGLATASVAGWFLVRDVAFAEAAAAYAYGDPDGGHPRAIAQQRRNDFHHESAFIRYAPLTITGSLRGMPALDPR